MVSGAVADIAAGRQEGVDPIADRVGRTGFPCSGTHVLLGNASDEQQRRLVAELEQELPAQRPVIAVFRVLAAGDPKVSEQRIVVVAFEGYTAVDAVPQLPADRALDSKQI